MLLSPEITEAVAYSFALATVGTAVLFALAVRMSTLSVKTRDARGKTGAPSTRTLPAQLLAL